MLHCMLQCCFAFEPLKVQLGKRLLDAGQLRVIAVLEQRVELPEQGWQATRRIDTWWAGQLRQAAHTLSSIDSLRPLALGSSVPEFAL